MIVAPNIIDRIVAAYAFSPEDRQHLADVLAQGYLLAKAQAYQRAQATAGHLVHVPHPWQVSEDDALRAHTWAHRQVDSVASTYEMLLRHALEQEIMPEERAIGDAAGKVKQAIEAVGTWIKGFLPWKTKQVAGQAWNTGANDGTMLWVNDVRTGGVTSSMNRLRVQVVPSESSSDLCSRYAGKTFTMEEASASDFPAFPMHISCIHSTEIIVIPE